MTWLSALLAVLPFVLLYVALWAYGDGWVHRAARRRAARKCTALAGHDWTPGMTPLHHGTCGCGWGAHFVMTDADWRALAQHPAPDRT